MFREIDNQGEGHRTLHMGTRKFLPRTQQSQNIESAPKSESKPDITPVQNNKKQSKKILNEKQNKAQDQQVQKPVMNPRSAATKNNAGVASRSSQNAPISRLAQQSNSHSSKSIQQSKVQNQNSAAIKATQMNNDAGQKTIHSNKLQNQNRKPNKTQTQKTQPITMAVTNSGLPAAVRSNNSPQRKDNTKNKLKVIPLGGLGEIGKNMTVFEYGDDILIVDCGLMFPTEEMMGIDLVVPDVTYLIENKHKIRAMYITHGHEDHIGGLAYIMPQIGNPPIYAARLTKGLIGARMRENRGNKDFTVNLLNPGEKFKAGVFELESFAVCHSIPDSTGCIITTPVGKIVHTGDFKIDYTPVDGRPSDLGHLAKVGDQGVLLLMSDSTHVETPGYTASEKVISETIDKIMNNAPGRLIVTTFASLISRIQMVVTAAEKYNRKVFIVGRGMIENIKISTELGYIQAKKDTIVAVEEIKKYKPEQIVLITTGSQGEPTSALVKIANKDHRQISIIPGDTVVLSSSPIPGNDSLVNRTIDNLFKQGANVIYNLLEKVHVSGHGSQEELKMMLTVVKPKYFMPVHGEFRHLKLHAELAHSLGIQKENIFAMEDGDILELTSNTAKLNGKLPVGNVYVDGLSVGDIGSAVLRSRQMLSRDGIVVAMIALSERTGEMVGKPDIVSLGFVDNNNGGKDIIDESKNIIIKAMDTHRSQEPSALSIKLRDALSNFYFAQTKRRPMVMPVLINV